MFASISSVMPAHRNMPPMRRLPPMQRPHLGCTQLRPKPWGASPGLPMPAPAHVPALSAIQPSFACTHPGSQLSALIYLGDHHRAGSDQILITPVSYPFLHGHRSIPMEATSRGWHQSTANFVTPAPNANSNGIARRDALASRRDGGRDHKS